MTYLESSTLVTQYSTVYGAVRKEDNPLEITKDVVFNLYDFIHKNVNYFESENQLLGRIEHIKEVMYGAEPHSHECEMTIQLIKESEPFISIVENKENYDDESRLNKFCWEHSLMIENKNTLARISNNNSFIAQLNVGAKIPLLTITKSAFNAIEECRVNLYAKENRERAERYQRMAAQLENERKIEAEIEKSNREWDQYANFVLSGKADQSEKSHYVKFFKISPGTMNSKQYAAYFMCVNPDEMDRIDYQYFKYNNTEFTRSIRAYLPAGRLNQMIALDSQSSCTDNMCSLF